MLSITKIGSIELEIATEFDEDKELEVTILSGYWNDLSVWLTKEEVKRLIEHLQNVAYK